ncbi:hypothetical protein HIM_00942 [Hirsutella minnesotensis 3608]|nr:hypothetical protein HIM_00942 [Hirsutella minnesotensis 3608]
MTHLGLTQTLLDSDPHGYERATQSAFLRNAARGKVPKEVLGQWLANDRLYINGYVQGAGRLLSFLALPETVPGEGGETPATRLAGVAGHWTSLEFVEFVDELGAIVDDAVREQVEVHGEGAGAELTERALGKWREVLAAEEAFWPAMEDE